MTEIVRTHDSVARVIEIVNDIRAHGYIQGRDFDFVYHPSRQDNFSQYEVAYTEFLFYNTSLSSWFVLKYS